MVCLSMCRLQHKDIFLLNQPFVCMQTTGFLSSSITSSTVVFLPLSLCALPFFPPFCVAAAASYFTCMGRGGDLLQPPRPDNNIFIVCPHVFVCVLIWSSQCSSPGFSSGLVSISNLSSCFMLEFGNVWYSYLSISAGRNCACHPLPIDWGKSVFVCVFSCSWRFTFYLLAFIAGLAALIDVSTVMFLKYITCPAVVTRRFPW